MSDFVDMLGHPLNVGDVIGVGQRDGSCSSKLGLYLIQGLEEEQKMYCVLRSIKAVQLIPDAGMIGGVRKGKSVTLTAWQGRTIKVEKHVR